MATWHEIQSFLVHHETNKENNGTDGGLIDKGLDQSQNTEPGKDAAKSNSTLRSFFPLGEAKSKQCRPAKLTNKLHHLPKNSRLSPRMLCEQDDRCKSPCQRDCQRRMQCKFQYRQRSLIRVQGKDHCEEM